MLRACFAALAIANLFGLIETAPRRREQPPPPGHLDAKPAGIQLAVVVSGVHRLEEIIIRFGVSKLIE